MKRTIGLIAVLLLVPAGIARAQSSDTAPPATSTDPDRAALAAIVMNAVTQVRLCSFAIEKTANADVKALCRRVSTDNARTALTGMQLARTLGATEVKFEPQPDVAERLDTLGLYTGSEFDRQFLLGQIERDENDENSIRYAAEFATDPAVRRYENAQLPNVERHLLLAETALRTLSEALPYLAPRRG